MKKTINYKELLILYLKTTNTIISNYTKFNSYINEINIFEANQWDESKCKRLLLRIDPSTDGKAFPWCIEHWNNCKTCTYAKYNSYCGSKNSIYQKIINKLNKENNFNEITDIPEIKLLIFYMKKELLVT